MLGTLSLVIALASATPAEQTVRLTVAPMAAPKPALKYQLLPELREMHAGNPAQWYVRCFAEQYSFFFSKRGVEERNNFLAMSLAELKVKGNPNFGGHAISQADWAARLDSLDWEILQRVQTEGTNLRLPELGPFRLLAESLRVRFRMQVAVGSFDAAVGTAKTMFGFARHLGEHPTLAANLLGMSIAELTLDTIEEMMQQPGCPNLYWALTDLPTPLVNLRKGLQGHHALVETEFQLLRDDRAMTKEELEELIGHLTGRLGFVREQSGRPPQNLRKALKDLAENRVRVGAIRSRLIEQGKSDNVRENLAHLKLMVYPPAQLILLEEKRNYEIRRDEGMKLLNIPLWQGESLDRKADASAEVTGLFAGLDAPIQQVRRDRGRFEQHLAILRLVEAFRQYAAEHGGALPRTLTDMEVPIPIDPFTGNSIGYQRDGETASLEVRSPKDSGSIRRYEIKMVSRDKK